MEIKKETVITPPTSDEKPMIVGGKYVFNTVSGCFAGEFLGLSPKGAAMFRGVIAGTDVKFNVLSRRITQIYEADISVKGDGVE